jgi:hypothetical protein
MAKYKPIVAVCADACEKLETQSGRIICTSNESELTALQDGINFERLAICWNICLNLENPESDIPTIIEALKQSQLTIQDMQKAFHTSQGNGTITQNKEALSLYKE